MGIGSKNYTRQTLMVKTVFYGSTYLVINRNTPFRPGEISPNKISIIL